MQINFIHNVEPLSRNQRMARQKQQRRMACYGRDLANNYGSMYADEYAEYKRWLNAKWHPPIDDFAEYDDLAATQAAASSRWGY